MKTNLTRKKVHFFLLFTFFAYSAFTQLECTIHLLEDGATFGVFVKPTDEISPSQHTVTGTGQITLVVPNDFQIENFQSVAGQWGINARVNAPDENPDVDYISVGFAYDEPTIKYIKGQETLLFSFQNLSELTSPLSLIDNEKDPFAQLPNSVNSNPGNELSVFDAGNNKSIYRYFGNYESETIPLAKVNSKE